MLARLFARQGQLAHANARGFALVSAETVKQLRQRTGAPINKCKQALEAEGGDLEAATSWLRKSGIATAQKKAGRGANDGIVGVFASPTSDRVALIELNSETDFVARNEVFHTLAQTIAAAALRVPAAQAATISVELGVSSVLSQPMELEGRTQTVEESLVSGVTALGARRSRRATHEPPARPKVRTPDAPAPPPRAARLAAAGENLVLRRACVVGSGSEIVSHYVHNAYAPGLGRTAAVVALSAPGAGEAARGALVELGQKLAMHIVAVAPQYLSRESVPAAKLEEESEVIRAQIAGSKKSPDVVAKIVAGKLGKFYEECVLLEQNYVLDDSGKVGKLVAARGKELGVDVTVAGFVRYHLGETGSSEK